MIKNIIFDIGNVLIHFAWEDYLHDLGYEGAMFDRVADAVFRSDDWDKGDSGLYTTQEWLDSFIENDPEIEEDIRKANDLNGQLAHLKREELQRIQTQSGSIKVSMVYLTMIQEAQNVVTYTINLMKVSRKFQAED